MITPAEIRRKAERQYLAFLRATVRGESILPLEIRFRKAQASDDYLSLRQWVADLLAGSKREQAFGYEVTLEERELRRYGRQSLPARITIPTQADFLRLINKEDEYTRWEKAIAQTRTRLPQLEKWLSQYPRRVLSNLTVWQDLLTVCAYFVANPRPNLYLRQLPLPIHTKFVEENQAILRHLLEELLPPEAICQDESQFERRFGLRYDEPQIRLRLLDEALCRELGWPGADISLPLSDCARLSGLTGRNALIVENKMTYLTLPPVTNGVAIWGKGFQAGLLREIDWLSECDIWYWGDLDAQGFAILSQLRDCWPQTQSFLMDAATLENYRTFVVVGTQGERLILSSLTEEESAAYQQIINHNWRLEQERISQVDVLQALNPLRRDKLD